MLRLNPAVHGVDAGLAALRRARPGAASRPAFLAVVALLFTASAAATAVGCAAMASHAQPMPGGWMLSTMETPMCGQGTLGALLAFAAMWLAMTAAMMLPALAPALWRYRSMLERSHARHADRRVAIAGAGYFAVWMIAGIVLHAIGGFAGEWLLQHPAWSRAMPAIGGVVVVLAGVLQFSAWKRHHLACCRAGLAGDVPLKRNSFAFRDGVRLGLHCNAACANFTVTLLALGMMDLRAMALATAAITAERIAPRVANVTEGIGIALVGVGACLAGQAFA